jgi:hypothetical protein
MRSTVKYPGIPPGLWSIGAESVGFNGALVNGPSAFWLFGSFGCLALWHIDSLDIWTIFAKTSREGRFFSPSDVPQDR